MVHIQMRFGLLAVVAALLAGCATAPQSYQVERVREYQAPREVLWSRLVSYFAGNQFQVKTISERDGVIHGEQERAFPQDASNSERRAGFIGGYADCGDVFTSMPEGQKIELNVVLLETAQARTRVTVNALFRETYYDLSGWGSEPPPRVCNSTGVLERQILDRIG